WSSCPAKSPNKPKEARLKNLVGVSCEDFSC
ncbi:MAG: hypothetical protein ACI9JE_001861, partial [Candidatus Krumholzibacteriia bacterium]